MLRTLNKLSFNLQTHRIKNVTVAVVFKTYYRVKEIKALKNEVVHGYKKVKTSTVYTQFCQIPKLNDVLCNYF